MTMEPNGRKATVFNDAQLYLLELFSRVKTDEELNEIKDLISDYYFKKTEAAWNRLEKQKPARKNKQAVC